ncbi:site-2 protease family protein [Variovorax sp. LT1P1]|uniref:site-2 protease family protein n=1 Tax=Variovorax sp. LT1P1 TaxID=3443730 RepID=UPI003F47D21A
MKFLLLLLSAGKLGKVLVSGGSMLLSVVAYAFVYGWRYAAGFVGLIFVHEMGHFLAARQRGLKVGAPTFIPFVGAWIELKEQPRDVETEAWIGLAGPLLGSIGALACYFAARATGRDWLLALSYAGFFLNLFNLVPLSPFDGGRITAVLTPRIWLLGVPVLGALFLWQPSPLLVLMVILALPQVVKAWRYEANDPVHKAYYAASLETRVAYGLYYLGLVAFLAVMAHDTHDMLRPLQHAGGA